MYRDIEFVCTGNKGRSPLAEAFAKKYLDKKGLLNRVRVSSSGTLVDFFKNPDDEKLAQILGYLIPKALEKRVITPEEAEALRQKRRVKEIQNSIFQRIRVKEEEQNRAVLEEKALFGYYDINRQPQQTILRPEAELIFPMGQENYDGVVKIYSNSKINPVVELFGEIEDPVFVTLDEFRKITEQIEEATESAMDKFL